MYTLQLKPRLLLDKNFRSTISNSISSHNSNLSSFQCKISFYETFGETFKNKCIRVIERVIF